MKTYNLKGLLICAAVVMLAGCNAREDALLANPVTNEIGVFDGCRVSYVDRGYNISSFYIARCKGDSVTTTNSYTFRNLKSTSPRRQTTIVQPADDRELAKIREETLESALEKLSPSEKIVLGIEE